MWTLCILDRLVGYSVKDAGVVLQGAGGCLHSKAATYKALRGMLASLGDPYTEFLWPSQVCILQPTPLSMLA